MLSDAAIRLALLTQLKKLGQADQEALALLSPSTTTVLPVGSGLDNGPIESLVCANSGINPRSSCGKPGTQKCSNVR
jgi:hypothetical protein